MLEAKYENKGNILVVSLKGELMLEDVSNLKREFFEYESTYKYFLFDFKEVTMIDSSGLGYIVFCLKKLREKDGDVKIHNLLDQAKLIFEITRVNSIIDIYKNENDAINSFKLMENENESNNQNFNEIIA